MDIVFLGTSAAMPTKQRNVSGIGLLPATGRGWYLVDCGEATQHQLLRLPMSVNALRAIFITHVHGDHSYGLPGLLACAAMSGRREPLSIIAPAGIAAWIEATCRLTELFLPFELEFVAVESLSSWRDGELVVEAAPLSHRVPSFAYRFTEARRQAHLDTEKLLAEGISRGPLWGRLHAGEEVFFEGRTLASQDYLVMPDPAGRIVVGGDNDKPELLDALCEGAQILVHEATYTAEVAARVGAEIKHCSAAEVARFAEHRGLPNLVLTHFSPRYQANPKKSPSIADVQAEAAAHYHGNLFLAEDFARYRLDKTGQLVRIG